MKNYWQLILPYWKSPSAKRGFLFLSLMLLMAVGNVYALVLLNKWNQSFYDALQKLDRPEFIKQLGIFFGISLGYSLLSVFRIYFMQALELDWRKWVTEVYLQRWLDHKVFYKWHLNHENCDNPDQRISEDIRDFIRDGLELFSGIFREVLTVISFIGILWVVSGSFKINNIFGYQFEVYSYLVWVAILFSLAGSYLMYIVGKEYVEISFLRQKFEAGFRVALVRTRDHAESIALQKSEEIEKQNLLHRLSDILSNFRVSMFKQRQMGLTSEIYGQIAYIFPFVVASPQLFAGFITLGKLFQISSAFSQVQGSLSYFVGAYKKIANWNSVAQRLFELENLIKKYEVTRELKSSTHFEVDIKNVSTPNGNIIINKIKFDWKSGERILAVGKSGVGKSTLVKLMQNLWPYYQGTLVQPQNKLKIISISQREYISQVPLMEFLGGYQNLNQIQNYLKLLDLDKFIVLLNETYSWNQILSRGEQQLLMFVKTLVAKPEWLFLDEATSALNQSMEEKLYSILLAELPNTAILSVSHHENLKKFHHKVIEII